MSKNYHNYLQSSHWKILKHDVRAVRRRCEVCSRGRKLHLHHRHYSSLGKEKSGDVLLLCERCHFELHEVAGKLGQVELEKAYQDIFKKYGSKRKKKRLRRHPHKKVRRKVKNLRRPNFGILGKYQAIKEGRLGLDNLIKLV